MQPGIDLILTMPPDLLPQARDYPLTIAHMAYRMGGGPHLYRSHRQVPIRGGLMVLDARGFDGRGDLSAFCREVLQECAARQFTGVLCDFEDHRLPALATAAEQLSLLCEKKGLTCYVPEALGRRAKHARVLISTALSGGSLRQRLEEAAQRFGSHRVVPAIERVAMDFYLPSPTGQGEELSREELKRRMAERSPSVFFSGDLCAHYFTYMSRQSGAHFVLFDDAASIRKKLDLARSLGFRTTVLAYPQVDDLLPAILR